MADVESDLIGNLTALEYDEQYYEEHIREGLDYLSHGHWQQAYARMVTDATLQGMMYREPVMVDVGCACGSVLKGFKDLGVYKRVLGIDMSAHMIMLGRRHFGFTEDELVCGSAANIPLPDNSVTLLQSGQVLEHIPCECIDDLFAEFYRVLAPGGRMFHNLAAIRHGNSPSIHFGDPTHVNVQPAAYWTYKFMESGFMPDFESFERMAQSPEYPGEGHPNFINTYRDWSSYVLFKPPVWGFAP